MITEDVTFIMMPLDDLRKRVEELEQPIDWTHINVPCGTDDAMDERRLARLDGARECLKLRTGDHRMVIDDLRARIDELQKALKTVEEATHKADVMAASSLLATIRIIAQTAIDGRR